MEEELVKFETAKLAKEKGFDEWCRHYKYPVNTPTGNMTSELNNRNTILVEDEFSAPTQALLQRWLREVHKIIVLPQRDMARNYNGWFFKIITHYKEEESPELVMSFDFNEDTYEQALEKGLIEGLKMIEL